MSRVNELLSLAKNLHKGQKDKQGMPLINHVRVVATKAGKLAGPSAWAVGIVHEVVEDEKATLGEMREWLDEDEFIALGLVTRRPDLTYAEYVRRIRDAHGTAGILARAVKRADLLHNLGRMTPELLESNPDLANRYGRALASLNEVEDGETVQS